MEITAFTFRILVLFLPGLICSYFVDAYTEHKPRTAFNFVLRSLIYGFLSYFLYWSVVSMGAWSLNFIPNVSLTPQFHFQNLINDANQDINIVEVSLVSISSIFLGIIAILESTYKPGYRLFQKLQISKKFGEIDVWGFALNSKAIEWVTVRDLEFNLVYDGWISAFSDDGDNSGELLLRDVEVYRNTTEDFLYKIPALYISREKTKISLEFRGVQFSASSEESNKEK